MSSFYFVIVTIFNKFGFNGFHTNSKVLLSYTCKINWSVILKPNWLITIFIVLIASSGYAHEAVKNPIVKTRMLAMSDIAANMKTIAGMARGISDFDFDKAKAALDSISSIARETPELFKEPEMDPKSEATLSIWDNYDDFIAKSKALEVAARGAETTFEGVNDLIPAMRSMGGTCKSCHSVYRK